MNKINDQKLVDTDSLVVREGEARGEAVDEGKGAKCTAMEGDWTVW